MTCPRCRRPMRELALPSHKGVSVTVEQCGECRLVWFDRFESVHLDALGWVRLLREMEWAAQQPLAEADIERVACPICAGVLKPVHNRSRFGLFAALECPHGHGHLHSHAGLLAERGLVRSPGVAEWRALRQDQLALHCLNCGAPASAQGDQCRHCRSPLLVVDLPRLAHSLKPRAELMAALPASPGRHASWACRGCGAPLDPARETECGRCRHPVVAHDLPDIHPLLDVAEALLAELAAAEAKRLARYPSTQRRAAPAVEAPPRPPSRWQRAMLGGWTPLLMAGLLTVVTLGAGLWGGLEVADTALQALRAQRLGRGAGTHWIWLEAHRLAAPADTAERHALRQGLFDVHLRQAEGEAVPPTLTVGQLLDGAWPPRPASVNDWPGRWARLISRQLRPVRGQAGLPDIEDTRWPHHRWYEEAPGLWLEERRGAAPIWALTVENGGPLAWPTGEVSLRMSIREAPDLTWRCRPAAGTVPVLAPGQRATWVCRPQAFDPEEARWRLAVASIEGGAPQLTWHDGLLASDTSLSAATDRWAADAAGGSARLQAFLRRHGLAGSSTANPAVPLVQTEQEAPPAISLAERWGWFYATSPRLALSLAVLGVLVSFCAIARIAGERRAYGVAIVAGGMVCFKAGWGEGAASVLVIAMYLAITLMATFVLGFCYRSYRAVFFTRRE
ncbi:zf-TFIIB domain-containing protein [Ideonella sp. DXS29W]|uniref:Zf-TFIIB domain-containing protein n=1 Tax=Ideonella lacteola TaxID=2984193 RepID=A0ABU9BRY5_9BURK